MNELFEIKNNIYTLAQELRLQERKIIDLSSNINPLGVSKKIKAELRRHLKYLHNYPDTKARRLVRFISKFHDIKPDMLIIGNGITGILNLLMNYIKPDILIMPVPTFPLYEKLFSLNSHGTIEYFHLNEEDNFYFDINKFISIISNLKGKFLNNSNRLLIVIGNPNNPTGRLIPKKDILLLLEALGSINAYLIVDEAYIDFCEGETVIPYVEGNPCLIVLRSFSCFYALPGLRIGYGVLSSELVDSLQKYMLPWTVNNLAQRAGVIALKDKVYRKETLALIKEEKDFFKKNFLKAGIKFYESDTNFYLIRHEKAGEIYTYLRGKGVLVRHCIDIKGLDSTYLRISVKKHRENSIFFKELFRFLEKV